MLEALVAGAGPAGSTAALVLARAGKNVCIYERTPFPRSKPCGEYLSAAAVRALHALGVGSELAPHARLVRGVRLHGHGVHARIDFSEPGWSLPRAVLDDALLNAALCAGANIEYAHVEGCEEQDDFARISFRLPDGITADTRSAAVVGADGMHSLVARKCGLAARVKAGARFALGGHYDGFAGLDEYIDMFVDGKSYAAINPLSDGSANVMLVLAQAELHANRDNVEAFAESRIRDLAGTLVAGACLTGSRVAIGPLSYRARRLAGRRVLLAGDAACFIDPFTGQGVYLALRCGQIAAQCIATDSLELYEPLARREISQRERAATRVRAIIRSRLLARTGAVLMRRAPWMFQPLVNAVAGTA